MSLYLFLKWVHILSSVVLVGTGFGTAFFFFYANRSSVVAAQAVVARLVVRADTWFTSPAVVIQPITGLWMAYLAGYPWHTPWLLLTVALYLFTGACWMPVVALQLRMADMAKVAHDKGEALPEQYWQYARRWETLGYPAFAAMLAVFYLMVAKPSLWA